MELMHGIITALVTPLHPDESLHLDELRRQAERQIMAGVHGLFCAGTNGEGYALAGGEKLAVLETLLDAADGRVPVYAGTGCNTTRETIEQSLAAKAAGAAALSIVSPGFARASQHELYEHYAAIARRVDIPILLYNIPARTGNALAPETVGRLAEIGSIVGVKDSSGDLANLEAYLAAVKGRKGFAVFSGNDQLILPCLERGGAGGVSGCANVYPATLAGIYECFRAGDLDAARRHQEALAPLRGCFAHGNPNTVVKTAVNLLGHPVGPCRAPFNHLPPEGLGALQAVLAADRERGLC